MSVNNPALYRKMSEPHPSPEAANTALNKFLKLVEAAREECQICDVSMVIAMNTLYPLSVEDNGVPEGRAQIMYHIGASVHQLPMLAYGYGEASAENRELVAKLSNGSITKRRMKMVQS